MVFTTFALVTMVTLSRPVRCAWANAASMMRSEPWVVMTRKSIARSSVALRPWLPTAYMSSVFSRKNVQSTPWLGMRTGRTFANRSSSLRMETFALSMLGQPSPRSGVWVGPLRVTWHCLISASTSSGMDCSFSARFSMVRPSMTRNSTLPEATSSRSRYANTACVSSLMEGPMPSPPNMPMMMGLTEE